MTQDAYVEIPGPAGTMLQRVADGAIIPRDPANVDYAAFLAAGGVAAPCVPPPPGAADVDAERERRLSTFTFGGVVYDFDEASRALIDKARVSAMNYIIVAGPQPGYLRWADPNLDFGWIAADNSFNPMDAQTCLAFGTAAASWEGRHILAARAIKNLSPIPPDYAANARWP